MSRKTNSQDLIWMPLIWRNHHWRRILICIIRIDLWTEILAITSSIKCLRMMIQWRRRLQTLETKQKTISVPKSSKRLTIRSSRTPIIIHPKMNCKLPMTTYLPTFLQISKGHQKVKINQELWHSRKINIQVQWIWIISWIWLKRHFKYSITIIESERT